MMDRRCLLNRYELPDICSATHGMENKLTRPRNLSVWLLPHPVSQELAAMAQRSMQLQATVQEGNLMLSDGANTVNVEPVKLR
jgi:uncharacterized protein YaeQ